MATRPNRDLKIGEIIDKTIGVISLAGVPSLIFIVVIGAMSAGVDIFAQRATAPGVIPSPAMLLQTMAMALLLIVLAVIGGYLLIEAMLKRTGLMNYGGDKRILAYVGMSILMSLAVLLGFLLVVIPGLVFMARWSVAGPLLIGKGESITAALGKSWQMTKGHEFPIVVVVLLIFVLTAISYLPAYLFGQPTPGMLVATRLLSTAGSVISAAMSVAIYGVLSTWDVSGTFS